MLNFKLRSLINWIASKIGVHNNTASSSPVLKEGDVVKDGPNAGWIYLEFNNSALYVAAQDSPDPSLYNERTANECAEKTGAQVPTDAQLAYILSDRVKNLPALKGTFVLKDSWYAPGMYRTSEPDPWSRPGYTSSACYRHANWGVSCHADSYLLTSLRLVRT